MRPCESRGGVFDGVFGARVLGKDEKNGCCCTKDRSPRQNHHSWQVLGSVNEKQDDAVSGGG